MRIIGLTGGMGTGKSTVAQILQQHGIPVADADQLARQALVPGSPVRARVLHRFGASIQTQEGELDRVRLGQIVFADPSERVWLEEQIHPFVKTELHHFLEAQQGSPTVCLMIPLLFEAGMEDWVSEIWVVTCTPEQQRQRLSHRDPLIVDQMEARIASQWPLTEKIQRAHVVLDNSGSLSDLQRQVQQALTIAPPHWVG
ncbi:dephospho-CoA kinase [Synechococcus sp. Nb3U1]|uniref:dephospho-CoA kinase n=1 Tax=Synechococcus sp. Nb3U1 TaxID=1914529 RepID=UPI001EEACD33|nr:dephospho-CoA kinase [Synechococcus sp. Nb3U1]MCF2971148.1 dephospho-CoA kinase [Synechococcus sp. Nb3U1]